MYINISYKFNRIPDAQSHFITKVHDLLGQPSYCSVFNVICVTCVYDIETTLVYQECYHDELTCNVNKVYMILLISIYAFLISMGLFPQLSPKEIIFHSQ